MKFTTVKVNRISSGQSKPGIKSLIKIPYFSLNNKLMQEAYLGGGD
jgi:hypothetical protein